MRPAEAEFEEAVNQDAAVSIPSAEAGGVRHEQSDCDRGISCSGWFQSPPPRRGACDRPTWLPSSNATVLRRFNPLRRGGGRATSVRSPQRTRTNQSRFQSPPPRRGACDNTVLDRGSIEDGKFTFQSPPPRRGACDLLSEEYYESIQTGRFNPLRRGGGRATACMVLDRGDGDREGHQVSIPSAEAGGVRPISRDFGFRSERLVALFQSPPPRRGACDPRTWKCGSPLNGCVIVSIPSAEAGGVRLPEEGPRMEAARERQVSIPSAEAGGVRPGTCSSCAWRSWSSSFNPLRRGGGRATPSKQSA